MDYGSKTVGVAVSDGLGWTAQALETITRKDTNKLRRTLARIEELVAEYNVERIVLGFPKHMNNDEGDRCAATEAFKVMLERRTGLPVECAGKTVRRMWTRWRRLLFCRLIWIG